MASNKIVANKTIVILGGGFIGKNLIRKFLSLSYEVRVLDRNPCPIEFIGKVEWHSGKLNEKEKLEELLKGHIYCVYHLVSSTVPGDKMFEILHAMQEDVFDTIQLVDICVKQKVRRLIFASSSSVYGLQDIFPITENAQTNPINFHGILKLTIEKYLYLLQHIHHISIVSVRISNPYGPGQNILGRQGFIAIAIGSILKGDIIRLRNNGQAVRDFVYINDLVNALETMAGIEKLPIVINIGSGTGHTLKEVVLMMEDILGRSVYKIFDAEKIISDIPKSILDISLAREYLCFSPSVSMTEGLRKTFAYHKII